MNVVQKRVIELVNTNMWNDPLLNSVGTRIVAAVLSFEGGYRHVRVGGGSVLLGGWL